MTPIKILYVDDYQFDRELIRDALEVEAGGFELVEASSKEEFEQIWETGTFDLVLTDFNISGYEGLQVLAVVRERDPDLPVIIVTGTGSEEVAVEAMKRGASDYVIKSPNHIKRLPQTITSVLENRKVEEEKEKAISDLHESEEKYKNLVEMLHEGIWAIDRDANTTFVNPAMADMLGYTVDEMMGKHLFSFMDESRIEECKDKLKKRESGEAEQHEFDFQSSEGCTVTVLLETNPIIDDAGQYDGAIAGVVDISERKLLQSHLAQARKMEAVGQLAGGVAHDFNNLLTVITGNADLVLSKLSENDPCREEIEEIHQAGLSAAHVTQQLLAFSRRQPMSMAVLDPKVLLDNSSRILRRVVRENILLKILVGDPVGFIRVDRVFFEQIILNLAINASDAMPGGGELTLTLDKLTADDGFVQDGVIIAAGEYAHIEVRDKGLGIPKSDLDHIFEPFFTTKGVGQGSGMGLSTAYGIVKQFGGYITASSIEGEGSVFNLLFPLVKDVPEEAAESDDTRPATPGPCTLMVVEDNMSVLRLTETILMKEGHSVLIAHNADDALAKAMEYDGRIDLVISDVIMPGMNGVELVEELRITRPDTKALFMSGYTKNIASEKDALRPGVNFLEKPFDNSQLLELVNRILTSD